MNILNGYPCIGGNRKLWSQEHKITAVEIDKKIADVYSSNFKNDKMIIGDAHQYLLDHFKEFDFIWLSPPCPTHSKMAKFTRHDSIKYPDMKLYQEIILLQNFFKGKWVVENVYPYYNPLIPPTKKIGRHLFWSNFPIGHIDVKTSKDFINLGTVADSEKMKKELGIYYEGNLYCDGNHDPCQVLRNCVDPKIGQYILDCAMNIIQKEDIRQTSIFD